VIWFTIALSAFLAYNMILISIPFELLSYLNTENCLSAKEFPPAPPKQNP